MNLKIYLLLIFALILQTPLAVGVTNPGFETGDLTGWSDAGTVAVGAEYAYNGNYGCKISTPGYIQAYASQQLTLEDTLSFDIKIVDVSVSNVLIYWQGLNPSGNFVIEEYSSTCSWNRKYIDTSAWNGYHGNLQFLVQSYDPGAEFWIDDLSITQPAPSTLSGWIDNNLGNPVSSATVTLNNSGGETTSNDTGYYEITGLSSGTYTITATSPTHQDYSGLLNMSGNTEKNITMTRLSPVLTYTDSDTTVTDVFLFWKRNIVVDNVRIYKDTETRLLTTVGSGSYLSGMYSDKNLDCNKGYVYWLQPMDGSVAGPKYRVDAKTDPCTDGGGGGTVPDPTPVVTPGPTVPPEINMTQEEWLNLTLEEKQDVLTNITLMAPVDRVFAPLLEFKWEDVLVWGINLFLILCAVIAMDSITTQKMSEYTGLLATVPGVMFAYLGGYLVI